MWLCGGPSKRWCGRAFGGQDNSWEVGSLLLCFQVGVSIIHKISRTGWPVSLQPVLPWLYPHPAGIIHAHGHLWLFLLVFWDWPRVIGPVWLELLLIEPSHWSGIDFLMMTHLTDNSKCWVSYEQGVCMCGGWSKLWPEKSLLCVNKTGKKTKTAFRIQFYAAEEMAQWLTVYTVLSEGQS